MSEEKITYDDIKEFEDLFTLAPPFILERFAKKNTNFVLKFKSKAQSFIDGLNDEQMEKFNIM